MTNLPQGLSMQEAAARRARGMGNAVAFKTGRSYLGILRKNLFTFINTILFAISILLVVMGQVDDALVTGGLVLLNALVGIYQESQAKYKLDRLALQVRSAARVIRSGEVHSIDPEEIVQGDIVLCEAGDQILADGRLVGDGRISVDESNLTGESERIAKAPGDPVYSGSYCTAGSGCYEVEKAGSQSTINRMTAAARVFRGEKTPMQRDIETIIRILVALVTALGLLLGMAAILSHSPAVEFVRIAAVIVALVPQGLFFMTTATYGMGMLRVAGRGALIQESNAVESSSHVNLLCLDKTGTLTTSQLALEEAVPLTNPSPSHAELTAALGAFAASMDAQDRTLGAIRSAHPAESRPVVETVPFSSEYKWSALRYAGEESVVVELLGAPEVLGASIPEWDTFSGEIERWTVQARRVLLFACSPSPAALVNSSGRPQLPEPIKPLGLVIFSEELRPEVDQTLAHFRDLGVKIKIISGDNPDTVGALARRAGLSFDKPVSGLELESLDQAQLDETAESTTVFGRMTPQGKERLVETFRRRGYYTAMIGDGVNDILPLKLAHLGVAMQSGAPATRSIADIVLLEDRFSALPAALREGQRIVRGMQDVIRLLLTRTFYVFLLVVASQIARAPFPVTPKHNALIALLTVGVPILAIAAWAQAGQLPKSMLRSTLRFVFPASITIALLVTGVYLAYLGITGDTGIARTALTATSILCGLLLLPFVEPPNDWWVAGDELSGDPRPGLLALAMLAAFAVIMAVPGLRNFFELVPLGRMDYALIAGLACAWGILQRLVWRGRLFERLLSLEPVK